MSRARTVISPLLISQLPEKGFSGVRVLIVGDLMLDKYIEGEVHRISPEAPVPVLSIKRERMVAGGAANVALNVAGLNAQALLAGVVGKDASGGQLVQLLTEAGVDVKAVVQETSRPTTCKTRVISGNHQIVRIDDELTAEIATLCESSLLAEVTKIISADVDAVILSDYAKGVLTHSCLKIVIGECRTRKIPVLVDPKRSDYAAYTGATCVTPNEKEFRTATSAMTIPGEDISVGGSMLRSRLQCEALLITQGSKGMTLITESGTHHLAALAEEVFDVSGAGDTVIATLSTALAAGLPFISASELANAAASLVVRHAGTSPIVWNDLYEFLKV